MIRQCQPRSRTATPISCASPPRPRVDVHPDPLAALSRAAGGEPDPPRRIPAGRRESRCSAPRPERFLSVSRRTASSSRGRSREHAGRGTTPRRTAAARRSWRQRQGARREPHDRRPHAQRHRAGERGRLGERSEPARGGELRAGAPAREHGAGQLADGPAPGGCGRRLLSRRVDDGRAQVERHGDPRPARAARRAASIPGPSAISDSTGGSTSPWSSAASCSTGRARRSARAGGSPRSRFPRRNSTR